MTKTNIVASNWAERINDSLGYSDQMKQEVPRWPQDEVINPAQSSRRND